MVGDPFRFIEAVLMRLKTLALTAVTMVAFAGNSILCRVALRETSIDPATFTFVRIVSGALVLLLMVTFRKSPTATKQNWPSAIALFTYAAAFSFAYVSLSTGTGALLLFGAVQLTMVGAGIRNGETVRPIQLIGLCVAIAGLVYLVSPGITAPPWMSALMMLMSGIAWGIYSLRGRTSPEPVMMTARNFMGAAPMVLVLMIFHRPWTHLDSGGILLGVASGALASALGYILWYTVLPSLRAIRAASVQLSVPVIAALGGFLFLNEQITARLMMASIAILGGIYLVLVKRT